MTRGQLLQNEPLAHYTSWRTGGPAKQLYKPADADDLSHFLQSLPATEPLLWLGLGSNTLIRDQGFAGTVIITQPGLHKLEQLGNGLIRAEAGVSCAQMARFSARASLEQAEFLAGIPGTIGGALRMNAGCFNGETWQLISHVETINRQGQRQQRLPNEYRIAYRHVTPPVDNEWFLAGYFQLQHGDKQASLEKIRSLLNRRSATQPTGDASSGSVFRNPDNDYAARLIECSGLKGTSIGGAQVSLKHANFIINDGTATATDIEQLIEQVATEVQQQQGVCLQREVHIIGNQ